MNYEFENKTVRELLQIAYKDYGIPEDGGQSNSHVKIEFTKRVYSYIPNIQARKAVVMKHDAHHLVTGTPFNLVGETEIAMWEIAAGCQTHWFAFLINSTAIPLGMLINLPNLFKAMVKGRRSKSLYENQYSDQEFLDMKAIDLQNELGLNEPVLQEKATIGDYFVFAGWLLVCNLVTLLVFLIMPLILLYNIYVFTIVRPQTI